MDDELRELLGVAEEDHENECHRCHGLYLVKAGDVLSKYCPRCGVMVALEGDDISSEARHEPT